MAGVATAASQLPSGLSSFATATTEVCPAQRDPVEAQVHGRRTAAGA